MSDTTFVHMKNRLIQLEGSLSQLEGSLTRLLNHLPGMAYRCTVDKFHSYTLKFVSMGSSALLGFSPAQIMENPTNTIERMMVAEDLGRVRRALKESILQKKSYTVYYRLRLPDQQEKWIWDQGEGVFDSNGNCIHLEGIMMDVTDQKSREMELKKENRVLRSSMNKAHGLDKVVGKSKAMQTVYSMMLKAAKNEANVILYGETGVGKDLIAKTIHKLSSLKGRYVAVNCAAIPEQLLESEFFGHTKGAFSGASSNRAGYLAAADDGTLFLDEIGELPLALQAKLLRALEGKCYMPVGSNETRSSHFRLISATNQDLKALVQRRQVRADFFYRIHVLTINIPPLREREGDIPLLIDAYSTYKGDTLPLPEAVMKTFEQYTWPGNVRELHNALERYWAFGGAEIAADAIPEIFMDPPPLPAYGHVASLQRPVNTSSLDDHISSVPLKSVRNEIEEQRIRRMLDQCSWRKGKTAEALGVTLRTLQRKIKKYGIAR